MPDGSRYLRWTGLYEFLISNNGRQIAFRPLNRSSVEALHTFLLGQVLSIALVKRGIEPLHATAVVIDGGAVGFLGSSGFGKSTLGAGFLQAGYPLLTDDLLVPKRRGGGFTAYPGPPRIKLFPHIAKKLIGDSVTGTRMNDRTAKWIIPLDKGHAGPSPVPLKALYVLRRPGRPTNGGRVNIRRLPPRRAYLDLLRNNFEIITRDPDRLRRQFLLVTEIASHVPVHSLSFPRDLDRLPAVRAAILNHLRE